ncbi:hypothetical protein LEP1GSC112_0389 [Leptospira interrogans serovar Pomona str. UT364]|nr:hypothetical protein LEP1GSC112_0389 [Leptospira interrogans serovar Pomona str. UT364]
MGLPHSISRLHGSHRMPTQTRKTIVLEKSVSFNPIISDEKKVCKI